MLVEELGFDGAIDYKRGDLLDQLREHTPEADGVAPVGRRVDTAPSEGRADVR